MSNRKAVWRVVNQFDSKGAIYDFYKGNSGRASLVTGIEQILRPFDTLFGAPCTRLPMKLHCVIINILLKS